MIDSNKAPVVTSPVGDAAGGGLDGGSPPELNDRLNTEFLDIPPDDTSIAANMTRSIAGGVGMMCTPRQVLVVLRILKAVTFTFLVLSVASAMMYLFFVSVIASDDVTVELGGFRDTTIRIYGLLLAVLALLMELDMPGAVRLFSGLKGFIPRALLIFCVATIANAHPLHRRSESYGGYGNAARQVPSSTAWFQRITSTVLGGCALLYFILGLLCFDRFTSRAFLSTKNPLVTTAIPQHPSTAYAPPEGAPAAPPHPDVQPV